MGENIMSLTSAGKSKMQGWFTRAKSVYNNVAGKGIDELTPNDGYGRDAMMSAFKGTGGSKRWGTAGGAALGGGYGAFSDDQSVMGGMAAGAMMGGIGGAAKNFIGKAGVRSEAAANARNAKTIGDMDIYGGGGFGFKGSAGKAYDIKSHKRR